MTTTEKKVYSRFWIFYGAGPHHDYDESEKIRDSWIKTINLEEFEVLLNWIFSPVHVPGYMSDQELIRTDVRNGIHGLIDERFGNDNFLEFSTRITQFLYEKKDSLNYEGLYSILLLCDCVEHPSPLLPIANFLKDATLTPEYFKKFQECLISCVYTSLEYQWKESQPVIEKLLKLPHLEDSAKERIQRLVVELKKSS